MKSKTTVIAWSAFFFVTLALLAVLAGQFSEPQEIKISTAEAQKIGQKVWMNEGSGKVENLIVWNEGEEFPSLGIGHFIWYPKDANQPFEESFPGLLEYISTKQALPTWLANVKYPPWQSRQDFLDHKNSEFTIQLRQFLQNTMPEQTAYMANRLEAALPKILKSVKNARARMNVRENFYHIANQKNGVYVLLDYVNFKGEGISESERYKGQGWGLSQALEMMDHKSADPIAAFVDAAEMILTRRVDNAPRDESRWLPGWKKRLQTYLQ